MREMSDQEAREFIRHNRSGILSLARDGTAYGIPLYYGHDGRDFLFQCRPGMKDEMIRHTREACFTIVRIVNLDSWASVQVFGPLERIGKDIPAGALMSVPFPPEWGETSRGEPRRRESDVTVYRLRPQRITGRYSENAPVSREEREIAFGGM